MASLPSYVAAAQPVPKDKRVPWFKTTAQTYAGIMLWFVFWVSVPIGAAYAPGSPYSKFAGGTLSQGLGLRSIGLVIAALICHFLFYLVPGMLGMKTGLPLYIVGTSTYGVTGGFLDARLSHGGVAIWLAWRECLLFGSGSIASPLDTTGNRRTFGSRDPCGRSRRHSWDLKASNTLPKSQHSCR